MTRGSLSLMATLAFAPLFGAAKQGRVERPAAGTSRATDPSAAAIVGNWRLNLGRTRYGPGVDRRRWERWACVGRAARIECAIEGARADGRVVRARFAAALDGAGAPVTGIADVDEVRLRTAGRGVLDATFLSRGAPAFGYRAYRAEDGRSLTVVSVDATSRAALSTVVVYDRE